MKDSGADNSDRWLRKDAANVSREFDVIGGHFRIVDWMLDLMKEGSQVLLRVHVRPHQKLTNPEDECPVNPEESMGLDSPIR